MNFSKMHGLGNDFMVIDAVTQSIYLSPEIIKRWANRHTGIGFDQLLVVEPPFSPEIDFHYRIFNADGNEVEQCGNGARCFARFVHLKGLTRKKEIKVSTRKGVITLTVNSDDSICVNMGTPIFEPTLIPFMATKQEKNYILRIENQTVFCSVVSMGNPHCVIEVENLDTANVEILGPLIGKHERFPDGVNVGFMQFINDQHIRLRVYERGSGETLACGSGACAAVAVGIEKGLLRQTVKVDLPGGQLKIYWKGEGTPLFMAGPAVHVYDGFIRN